MPYGKPWPKEERESRRLAYQKEYRATHHKERLEHARKYLRENREKMRAYNRRYYHENIERARRQRLESYYRNVADPVKHARALAKRRQTSAVNREKYPEKYQIWVTKRKALLCGALHPEHDPKKEISLRKEAIRLSRKTGICQEIDHIIPLSRGGQHHHKNLQILPAEVNNRKNKQLWWFESGYKSFLNVPLKLWPKELLIQWASLPDIHPA